MKHVGMVANTGRRCIVVFREIYDERGKVVEPDKCLVVETDTLPDHAHQDIISIVESEPAQRTGNFYEVLARSRMTEGSIALSWLHNNNRLKKYDTSNVYLLPDSSTKVRLDKINKIVALQKSGASQQDIENVMRDDTDQPPRQLNATPVDTQITDSVTQSSPVAEPAINKAALAETLLKSSEQLLEQAKAMQIQAQELLKEAEPKKAPAKPRAKKTLKNASV
jgi:hypothetical protein